VWPGLPVDKEGLERYFAERFVEQFNVDRLLGPDVVISNVTQNGTADLDFSISSAVADYLELAELNPRSEAFGRAALRTGKLNVYQYARWVFFRVIQSKAKKYGNVASRTVLLLFVTHCHPPHWLVVDSPLSRALWTIFKGRTQPSVTPVAQAAEWRINCLS
jgi:hypothetical protein